ncbi:pimeloyl-CoA dehydrogenase large subunit [Bradyrhizobium sp. CSS354]|uniref:pimeloyl-CoA dehydrogenase large subunit n=1 Tax=Bradyrhizobium sp. CSS354 TaxID=2699172 RepID=UPI0023B160E1|nr:pimeloyl-CoA dehydrogenase large subunit [Bradyrhizobium sp. CSS354]MDE5466215.1 pimeloyl-CoA dehydrogenase large subunit [Bradyrhizobium sp. CSS354]
MDIAFTKEERAFREGVRQFLRDSVPPETRRKVIEGRGLSRDEMVGWTRILHRKGWAVPDWPREYGGTGWTPAQLYIFGEELQMYPVKGLPEFGTSLVGPVIYTFGTEAQKKYYLPRIANGDDWWCQGFSEPGAGSDLASLKTRAVRDGDHYIINGQKIWTTLAQHADWIFCLVRTNLDVKKQLGISFLLVDMKSPGITVRPIQLIDGSYEVNEVFFDNVRVPAENLVGEENKGWDYAKFLLGNERFNIATIGSSKERVRRIKALATVCRVGDERLIDQIAFREKVAALEVRLKALEMTQLRVVANASKRQSVTPDPASAILKIKASEVQQATAQLLMDVVGPYAQPYSSDEDIQTHNNSPIGPDWAAAIAPAYFNVRKVSIYGGSDEIQKNIIAKAILGL